MSLFMLWIVTNYTYNSVSSNNHAFITNFFHRWFYFHNFFYKFLN